MVKSRYIDVQCKILATFQDILIIKIWENIKIKGRDKNITKEIIQIINSGYS